jgi:hypothetical protein
MESPHCLVASKFFHQNENVTKRNIYLVIMLHTVTMKPVLRLKPESQVILSEYHNDGNTAIYTMQIKLKDAERTVKLLQSVTKPVEKMLQPATFGEKVPVDNGTLAFHTDAYWKKLSETVDSCIERAKRY